MLAAHAAAVSVALGDTSARRIVDLGAGTGVIGFEVQRRISCLELVLVEREPTLAALAVANSERLGMAARVLAVDVRELPDWLERSASVVVCNAPYFRGGRSPSDPLRAAARHGPVEPFLAAIKTCLSEDGLAHVVRPAEDLADFSRRVVSAGLAFHTRRSVVARRTNRTRLVLATLVHAERALGSVDELAPWADEH